MCYPCKSILIYITTDLIVFTFIIFAYWDQYAQQRYQFINYKFIMNAKHKSRIFSQQPHYSSQKRQNITGENGARLLRMPSFKDEHVLPPRKISKFAYLSKLSVQYGVSLHPTQQEHQRNIHQSQKSKQRRLLKGISQYKFKASPINGQINGDNSNLFTNNEEPKHFEENEAKINNKDKKRKPKQKRNSIYFTKGNNHELLRQVFLQKFSFKQATTRELAHICWLQSSNQKQLPFANNSLYLPQIAKSKANTVNTIYNYLEGQSQLTNKEKLYKNMKKYYPQSIGQYIPKTFVIDFKQESHIVQQNILEFIGYYMSKQNKHLKVKSLNIKNYFIDLHISNKQIQRIIEGIHPHHAKHEQEQPQQPSTLWILKPTSLNRGRGIHLFSSLKQLSKLLSQSSFEISVKMYHDDISPKSYIIQEYIQRPLLIDGYKFDMRVWVFINIAKINGKKGLKAYLFRNGYSRLASVKYRSQEQNGQHQSVEKSDERQKKQKKAYINNRFIHLTNNAVQKQAKQYGHFCQGNQLSIQQTIQYFHKKQLDFPLTEPKVIQTMKKIVNESISSVKERFVAKNTTKTFQLLGYDFLIDQNHKIWLIEINCNPCIQESSQLLAKSLRTMLTGLVVLSELQDPRSETKAQGWMQIL